MEKINPRKFVSEDKKIYHGFRKAFLQNENISLEARFLLVLLMTYKGKNEDCWPSQGTLGKKLDRSRRTVSKYLKELKQKGFLKITYRGIGRSLLYSPNYLPVQKANKLPDKKITQEPTQTITVRSIDSENIDSEILRIRRGYVNDKGALTEFQTLYLKEFQIRLTKTEATDYGNRLISLVKAVCGNDPFELKAIDRLYGKEKN